MRHCPPLANCSGEFMTPQCHILLTGHRLPLLLASRQQGLLEGHCIYCLASFSRSDLDAIQWSRASLRLLALATRSASLK